MQKVWGGGGKQGWVRGKEKEKTKKKNKSQDFEI